MEKKKNKRSTVILILVLFLCMAVGVLLVFFVINKTDNLHNGVDTKTNVSSKITIDKNGEAINGQYKSKSSAETLAELEKEQIKVTDKMSSLISFPCGKVGTVGSWMVENLSSNNVVMQCEIFQDNILIAKSMPIYPNQHIESITLSENIPSGTYDVIAYINYFKIDTHEYISKAGYKIKLSIQ